MAATENRCTNSADHTLPYMVSKLTRNTTRTISEINPKSNEIMIRPIMAHTIPPTRTLTRHATIPYNREGSPNNKINDRNKTNKHVHAPIYKQASENTHTKRSRATHTILRSNTPQRIMCHGALSMMDDRRFVSSLALHGMLPATHVYGA
ncbi:hypothetical protein HJC23_000117 [Cyclotella cryptica]|uniref:Uncharacterized protein n=1 Tax=Cyclotella cryptica TaxID=29204 RepID=A0ABD3NYH8_9STRA